MRPASSLTLIYSASCALAGVASTGAGLEVRNAPGKSISDTLWALRHHLNEARLHRRDEVFSNSTEIEAAFSNVVLLKVGRSIKPNTTETGVADGEKTKADEADGEKAKADADGDSGGGSGGITQTLEGEGSLEIVCKACYIKGTAHASLSINGDVNASAIFGGLADAFVDVVDTITDNVTDYGKEVFASVQEGFESGDFDLPPLDIKLDIDVPDLPEAVLKFGFDQLELYIDMSATLGGGATYTVGMYDSSVANPYLGFMVGEDILVGVVFTVDLIISVNAEVTIESGFHLKLDDGFSLELSMFAKEVANLEINGGQFEFLPVVVETDGILLSAVLRLAMRSGLSLKTPSFLADISERIPSAGGGIEASVYANLAELTTNITLPSLMDDDDDCHLRVTEEFRIEIGAAAGASVVLGGQSWGPMPATQTPLFYTTLADICALGPAASSPPTIEGRQDEDDEDLSTTTTETKKVYTGVECLSTGLMACPASLQSVHKFTVTETLSTAVPSGADVDWDATVGMEAFAALGFGSEVKSLLPTSGRVQSFVPPPEPTSTTVDSSSRAPGATDGADTDDSVGEVLDGSTGGVSNKVIIGVSVGVGVPVLLAIIGGIVYFVRRRRNLTRSGTTVSYSSVPDSGAAAPPMKNAPMTEVSRESQT